MNEHTDGDLQADIAALRQRLSNLEAEYRNLERKALHASRPVVYRKFPISILPVALVLVAGGVLYALDALMIDNQGNTNFVGNVSIGSEASRKKLNVFGTLDVNGNATVGGLEVAGGIDQKLRLLHGVVSANGSTSVEGKFTARSQPQGGFYTVYFTTPFKSMPAASVTADNDEQERDRAVITRLDEKGMRVRIVNNKGQAENANFSFVIIGLR